MNDDGLYMMYGCVIAAAGSQGVVVAVTKFIAAMILTIQSNSGG